jgi:hypothetical protein
VLKNDFVCFGIFHVYRDPSLRNLIRQTVHLISSVGINEILRCPPRAIAVWNCFEAIAECHLAECDEQSLFVILEGITNGIRSEGSPLQRESFKILRGVALFELIGQLAEQVKECALLLMEWMMNQPLSQLIAYASILRMLMATDANIFGCLKMGVLRYVTFENEEKVNCIFQSFESDLPKIIQTHNDLKFGVHLENIHKFLASLQTRIVFCE